ncbi:uncharacterized protein LOC116405127 [Cucumis sativus]|uniref:uncharacterized protein LOC116405127 n=1 Tax=Cucumis sativus TaxID=3659 RepID=UPI0012F48FCA|nr:uncharacterized protein LOC116405127 [Cucumis sativus]
MRQKSQIRWLKLDDQNTAFFHRYVRSRQSSNALRSVIDPDGNWLTNHDQVTQVVVNYFKDSLGSQNISYRELSTCIEEIVQFRWTEECCQALQSPIGRKEVRRVLFSMDGGKAPGRDGYSVGFFKGAWTVVGEGFCDVVLHFFETNYFPQGVNTTAITLIGESELVRAYHLHRGKPRSTMKVDLQKAYDSVNWDFLFGLLIAIGFFHGRKGLRQGDPLSPFLFVMVMEVLSRMLNSPPQNFQFHQFCEKVRLTHLTFIDDLMIFCTADNHSISFIKETIKRFGELSGLFANLAKSSIFLWGLIVRKLLGLLLTWVFPLVISCRLQLVRSVLRSLQVYWASVFMLPMKVHRDVDKILRTYLWRGGLDIRDGSSWNIASTLKILRESLWEIDAGVGRSWCFKEILRKWDILKAHVKMEVGNGRKCRVWLVPWIQGGPIIQQFGRG